VTEVTQEKGMTARMTIASWTRESYSFAQYHPTRGVGAQINGVGLGSGRSDP
jgi:hypothetical protein